jgi:hypothetical protein
VVWVAVVWVAVVWVAVVWVAGEFVAGEFVAESAALGGSAVEAAESALATPVPAAVIAAPMPRAIAHVLTRPVLRCGIMSAPLAPDHDSPAAGKLPLPVGPPVGTPRWDPPLGPPVGPPGGSPTALAPLLSYDTQDARPGINRMEGSRRT